MQTHCRDEAGEGAFIDHMKSRLDAANNTRIHIDDRRRDPESLSLQLCRSATIRHATGFFVNCSVSYSLSLGAAVQEATVLRYDADPASAIAVSSARAGILFATALRAGYSEILILS
jgi:hypothetical protein